MTTYGDKYILTIELDEEAIISGFLIVEGHSRKSNNLKPNTDDETQFHVQDILSYVGNDPDYHNNQLCNCSPALDRDSPDTYYYDEEAKDKDIFGLGNGIVHKNGVEIECVTTLVGKYVTIEINMGKEKGNDYSFEICSLAVLGTTEFVAGDS